MPQFGVIVETSFDEIVAEPHVVHDAEFLGDVVEIALHFRPASEVLSPRIFLLETEFVGRAQCVDANIGVAVDAPGATQFFAALVHREVNPKLCQLHTGGNAVESSADDGDVEALGRFDLWTRPFSESGEVFERQNHLAKLEVPR